MPIVKDEIEKLQKQKAKLRQELAECRKQLKQYRAMIRPILRSNRVKS